MSVGQLKDCSGCLEYLAEGGSASVNLTNYTSGGAEVARNQGPLGSAFFTSSFFFGDRIGPGLAFSDYARHINFQQFYYAGTHDYFTNFPTVYDPDLNFGDGGSRPAIGVPFYIGVRILLDGDYHYGWIGGVFDEDDPRSQFSTFAWGYETDPMTPIAAGAVPAPGTLAALAFGAAAALGRRKRVQA